MNREEIIKIITDRIEDFDYMNVEAAAIQIQDYYNLLHPHSEYWRRRCEAAEEYIRHSPCDPDICPRQEQAYENWQAIKKENP